MKSDPQSGFFLKREKSKATDPSDWLAWFLHFVLGFLIGMGIGVEFWRFLRPPALGELILVISGCGLIGGAFASYYGNRAWMARSMMVPPESPPPQQARACSQVLGAAGATALMLAFVHHLQNPSFGSYREPTAVGLTVAIIAAGLSGYLVVNALRTGNGAMRFRSVDRYQTPFLFWIFVAFNSAASIAFLSLLL